jgi:hypothetical protein
MSETWKGPLVGGAMGVIGGFLASSLAIPIFQSINPLQPMVQAALENHFRDKRINLIEFFSTKESSTLPLFVSAWCGWEAGVRRTIELHVGEKQDQMSVVSSTSGEDQIQVSFVVPSKHYYKIKAMLATDGNARADDRCHAYSWSM